MAEQQVEQRTLVRQPGKGPPSDAVAPLPSEILFAIIRTFLLDPETTFPDCVKLSLANKCFHGTVAVLLYDYGIIDTKFHKFMEQRRVLDRYYFDRPQRPHVAMTLAYWDAFMRNPPCRPLHREWYDKGHSGKSESNPLTRARHVLSLFRCMMQQAATLLTESIKESHLEVRPTSSKSENLPYEEAMSSIANAAIKTFGTEEIWCQLYPLDLEQFSFLPPLYGPGSWALITLLYNSNERLFKQTFQSQRNLGLAHDDNDWVKTIPRRLKSKMLEIHRELDNKTFAWMLTVVALLWITITQEKLGLALWILDQEPQLSPTLIVRNKIQGSNLVEKMIELQQFDLLRAFDHHHLLSIRYVGGWDNWIFGRYLTKVLSFSHHPERLQMFKLLLRSRTVWRKFPATELMNIAAKENDLEIRDLVMEQIQQRGRRKLDHGPYWWTPGLGRGANEINGAIRRPCNPLETAIVCGHLDFVRWLLERERPDKHRAMLCYRPSYVAWLLRRFARADASAMLKPEMLEVLFRHCHRFRFVYEVLAVAASHDTATLAVFTDHQNLDVKVPFRDRSTLAWFTDKERRDIRRPCVVGVPSSGDDHRLPATNDTKSGHHDPFSSAPTLGQWALAHALYSGNVDNARYLLDQRHVTLDEHVHIALDRQGHGPWPYSHNVALNRLAARNGMAFTQNDWSGVCLRPRGSPTSHLHVRHIRAHRMPPPLHINDCARVYRDVYVERLPSIDDNDEIVV